MIVIIIRIIVFDPPFLGTPAGHGISSQLVEIPMGRIWLTSLVHAMISCGQPTIFRPETHDSQILFGALGPLSHGSNPWKPNGFKVGYSSLSHQCHWEISNISTIKMIILYGGNWFQERPLDCPNKINFLIYHVHQNPIETYWNIVKYSETMYHWIHFLPKYSEQTHSTRKSRYENQWWKLSLRKKKLGKSPGFSGNWNAWKFSWRKPKSAGESSFFRSKTAILVATCRPGGSGAWAAPPTDLWRLGHLPSPEVARPTWKQTWGWNSRSSNSVWCVEWNGSYLLLYIYIHTEYIYIYIQYKYNII